jgi:hypothetical protein
MAKKLISMAFVLTLLLSLVWISPGSAHPSYGNRYGQVTAVSPTKITIKNFENVSKVIWVDSSTVYYRENGAKRLLSDIKVGKWIFASGTNDDGQSLLATTILLVPTKYAGSAYWNYRREYGTVVEVNLAYGTFFVSTDKSGTVRAIAFGRFINKNVAKLSQMKVGMKVAFAGTTQSNNYVLATAVIAFTPKP